MSKIFLIINTRRRCVTNVVFTLIFSCLVCSVFGQTLKIVPPTPNAMKMTEYHAQRPNMYTGTANVSIPLYAINFDGWDLPLSLSYNATGVRTNEEASEVGLGWALSATGSISRVVRGGDDLFPGTTSNGRKGYVYSDRAVTYEMGYDSKTEYFPSPTSYYSFLALQNQDTEPDIFNYNFFGYSGSFVLTQKIADPNPDPLLRKVLVKKIKEDATSIQFNEIERTFVIITPTGYRGEFSVQEKSTTFSSSTSTNNRINCCGENNIDINAMLNSSGRFRAISTWYLSKITSPKGQQITFDYDLRTASPDGIAYSPSYPDGTVFSPYISNTRAFAEIDYSSTGGLLIGDSPSEVCIQTVHEHVYLKKIESEEVQVDFLMEDREDLRKNYLFSPDSSVGQRAFHSSSNLKRYNRIEVKGKDPSSTLNKLILLKQSYFNQQFHNPFANDQNERELRWLRSRLDRITIDDQEYQFFYEKGLKGLPNKMTTGIDHFGFYNGKDEYTRVLPPVIANPSCNLSDTLLIRYYSVSAGRVVNFDYGKAGTLNMVKYPTRGYSVFEYEPHTYLPDNTTRFIENGPFSGIAGGTRIKSIKEYDYTNNTVPARSKSYLYTEVPTFVPNAQGATTGKLMTPLLNRYLQLLYPTPPTGQVLAPGTSPNACVFRYHTNTNIPGSNSAEGRIIGYSKIHEIVIGTSDSFRNTYYFENRPNQVSQWNLSVASYPNLNGQVTEIRNYDSQGKLVQRTSNSDFEHTLEEIKAISYINGVGTDGSASTFFIFHTRAPLYRVFNTPYTVLTVQGETPSGIVEDGNGNIVSHGNSLTTQRKLTFNSNFLQKTEEIINSKNEVILKEFKRPTDYTSPSPTLSYMKSFNVNMVEPVIEEITRLNGVVRSALGNRYELENGVINLKATYGYNSASAFIGSGDGLLFGSAYDLQEEYSQYDPVTKKLLQYTDRSGVINSFIWSYNNKLPIVHGLGIGYNQLNTAFSSAQANGAIGSDIFEGVLRNHSNTVGKQITTYLHNPLVGVTKITGPTGEKKTFQYDVYARLQKILDKDGLTLEQYKYHFKERQPTRILNVTGNLNFGVLTPDMFLPKQFDYVRCSDGLSSRVLTLTNDGEVDLQINSVAVLPYTSAFSFSWQGGWIAAGTSVDVVVSFNGTVALADYNGTVVISAPDRTNTNNIDVPISARYTARNPSMSFSPVTGSTPKIYDFGTVTGLVAGQYIEVTNTGNAPFRLDNFPFEWDGSGSYSPNFYTSFKSPDFSVAYQFGNGYYAGGRYSECISVGQTVRVPIIFNPAPGGPNGIRSAKLSFTTDVPDVPTGTWPLTLYKDAITVQANLQRPISTISMNTDPVDFGTFTETLKTRSIIISNSGTLGFTVNGITVADAAVASWFTLSPSTWTLDPGTTKEFVLTFQPPVKDVTANTTITINNDAMYGNESFSVTGRRYSFRKMILSTEPDNVLVFDNANEAKPITITNATTSNDNLSVNDYRPANNSLQGWAVTSFTPRVLVPGESMTMQIMRTGASPSDQPITIGSTKSEGVDSFTLKNGVTRVIGLTTSPATTLPLFSTPTITQDIAVNNSGSGALTVGGITSSNPMFAVSPNTLVVAPNSQQTVTVTFTPTAFNFSQQSATLSFFSDATSGTGTIVITGQRTALRTIQLSPSSLIFDYTGQTRYVTVSNVGNDNLNINGVSYPSTPNWSASISPTTLAPGQSTSLSITRTTGENEPLSFTVNSSKNGGNEIVTVGANTRVIGISPGSLAFPPFSGPSISQDVTISNTSGNSTLSITDVSSTNGVFTVSPTILSIPAGGQQNVTVTFSPGSFDFSAQNGTLSFNSNKTSGNNTLNVSGQRTALRTIQLSTNSLTFDYTGQTQYVTVSNGGNDNLYISGVLYPNTPNWYASITPTTLSPGQSSSLAITKTTGTNEPISFTVNSTKNGGNDVVEAIFNIPPSRIISISPVSFSSFTGTSTTSNMTISNNGNSTLTINSISSSNPKFTFSTTSFSITAGGQQTVVVTFSSSDFGNESATFTVGSDASAGSSTISTSAQRTQLAQLSVYPTTLSTIRPWAAVQSCYITNTGNVNATINSIGNNSPGNFGVTTFSGGYPVSVPFTLAPGAQFEIQVRTVGSNYSSANGQLYIHNSVTSFYTIYLSRATF